MWFKQIQLFQLAAPIAYDANKLTTQLEPLAFRPCLPSLPFSHGFIAPFMDESEAPLVQAANDCLLICLQIEEKVLPMAVVRQEVDKKVKEFELHHDRKMPQKQKHTLKDETIHTLLPRAFSKLTHIYAYIDTKNNWLILNTTSTAKTEKMLEHLKKAMVGIEIQPIATERFSSTLTQWLLHQSYPQTFSLEKSCVLSGINEKNRVIRCQHQDLYANNIQSLVRDNCEVRQVALSWQDNINFILTENFHLTSIKFQDKVIEQTKEMEPETKQQQLMADFFIMTSLLSILLKDLVTALIQKN